MTWLALFPIFVPACALLAGVFTWTITRGERPDDGELLRHFLVALAMLLLVSYAITTTDAVKERLNPSIKARKTLEELHVHVALKEHLPAEWQPIEQEMAAALSAQVPLPQVMSQMRTHYLRLVRRLLPFSRSPAVLAYGEALLPALRELQPVDAGLCLRLAWPRAGAPFDASGRLSAPVAFAYEAAVAQVVEQNSLAVTRDGKARPPEPPGAFASLGELQAGYAAIGEAMEPRFGAAVGQLHTPGVTDLDPAVACAATIELISRSLAQPPGVARALLTNLLRS